jgi:hypothetical protein
MHTTFAGQCSGSVRSAFRMAVRTQAEHGTPHDTNKFVAISSSPILTKPFLTISNSQMKSTDPEQSSLDPIPGFPSVAQKIASDNDKTTTIYRRFDRLSARNILSLQAELAELERQQDRNDLEDARRSKHCNDHVVTEGLSDWKEFVENADRRDQNGDYAYPREKEKLDLALKIRGKLKEYRNRES